MFRGKTRQSMSHNAFSAVTKLERNVVTKLVMDEVTAFSGAGLEVRGMSEFPIQNDSRADFKCYLQLSFVHNEPVLRREIRHVPG
jgi:hypothetical protein